MHVWRAGHLWAHWCHNGSTAPQEQLVALLGLFVELRRLVEEQQRLGLGCFRDSVFMKCVNWESLFNSFHSGFSRSHGSKQVFCFLSYLSFSTLSLSSLKSVPVIMRLILLYYSCIRRLILISYWSPSKYRDAFGIWFQRDFCFMGFHLNFLPI